jgi:iron complex transport system ATP-binding protein
MVSFLDARELRHVYEGGFRALDGIDLTVEPGELVCVLGPNGAGKSTLLRVLAGLVVPTHGTVQLEGRVLASLGAKERARSIALVPQALRALPDVTVETFVGYGRYAHMGLFARRRPSDREAVRRALELADAADLARRPLAELSGGQRQRALIARALAQEARLLLIDEPTIALDPEHQVLAFEQIARLTCEGRAALVVTHDMNLASQFATRILLLDAGRVAAQGSVSEVLRAERLAPVYGPNLAYGTLPGPGGEGTRPFVLPWLVKRRS